jgi:DMSO/TMAO reductase YedYZ molybdopterin-dependent catalytic subunit
MRQVTERLADVCERARSRLVRIGEAGAFSQDASYPTLGLDIQHRRCGRHPHLVDVDEFRALPSEMVDTDIHCVTKWSKLGTTWTGISLDTLLNDIETSAKYVLAFCDGGYTTNLPLDDISGGKAWIAYEYDHHPLAAEHGGPARLLVPHLYFWKSAKWVRGIELRNQDQPGFWEH